MSPMFESIESAHEYVGLLLEAIEETVSEVKVDLDQTSTAWSARERETFRLIAYKLEQLQFHLGASQSRLNDLRILDRMLEEGSPALPPACHRELPTSTRADQ
jgi:hypothetical protein